MADVTLKIGADSTAAVTAVRSLTDSFNKISIASAAVSAAFVAAGAATARLVIDQNEAIEATQKAARAAGVGVEKFSALAVAFKDSGVEMGALSAAMRPLNKNIVEAATGSGAAADAFKRLGVSVKDSQGNLRNTDEVLGDVSAAFAELGPGAEAATLAQELFGRSGTALLPVLFEQGEALRDATAAAERYGLVITEEAAAAAIKFNDEVDSLNNTLSGLARAVTTDATPALTTFVKNTTLALTELKPLIVDVIGGLVKGIANIPVQIQKTETWLDRFWLLMEGPPEKSAGVAAIQEYIDSLRSLESQLISLDAELAGKPGAAGAPGTKPTKSPGGDLATNVAATVADGIVAGFDEAFGGAEWDSAVADIESKFFAATRDWGALLRDSWEESLDKQNAVIDAQVAARDAELASSQKLFDLEMQRIGAEEEAAASSLKMADELNKMVEAAAEAAAQIAGQVAAQFTSALSSGSGAGFLKGLSGAGLTALGVTNPAAGAAIDLSLTLAQSPKMLQDIAKQLAPLTKSLIGNVIPALIKDLPKIGVAMMTGLIDGVPLLVESLVSEAIPAFIQAMPQIITSLVTFAPAIAAGIITGLADGIPILMATMADPVFWYRFAANFIQALSSLAASNQVFDKAGTAIGAAASAKLATWSDDLGTEFENWGTSFGEKAVEPFGEWLESLKTWWDKNVADPTQGAEGAFIKTGGREVKVAGTEIVRFRGAAPSGPQAGAINGGSAARVGAAPQQATIILQVGGVELSRWANVLLPQLTEAIANSSAGRAHSAAIARQSGGLS